MGLALLMDPNLPDNLTLPHHRADLTKPLSDMHHRAGNCFEPPRAVSHHHPSCQEGFLPCAGVCADAEQSVLLGEKNNLFRSVNAAASHWESHALRDLALCLHLFWSEIPSQGCSFPVCVLQEHHRVTSPLLLLPKGEPSIQQNPAPSLPDTAGAV